MCFVKNKKGQAMVEFVIILHVFVVLFFAVLFFSTYMFDRLIVLYAANIAINEGVGMAPADGITAGDLEAAMYERAENMLRYRYSRGNIDIRPQVDIQESANTPNTYGTFRIRVVGVYDRNPPFRANIVPIEYTLEVDYVW